MRYCAMILRGDVLCGVLRCVMLRCVMLHDVLRVENLFYNKNKITCIFPFRCHIINYKV